MSTSTASAPDTDTNSIPSLQEKKQSSPSLSPQPDNRPPSDDAHTWNFDAKQLTDSPTPKVQLPSIFRTFEDPFRNDIRRASLQSIASDSASNTRYRTSPYPQPATRRSHAPANQPNPPTYHFPSPVDTQEQCAEKPQPRLNYNNYSDSSPYSPSSLPSAPASTSQMSSFASRLSPDLRPQHAHYVESDDWSNSPSTIARPSSTPNHPSLTAPLKYEDGLRHSSFSAPIGQQQMFTNANRISAQQDRRPYPPGAQKPDEWSFPNQEFVLPSSNPAYTSASTPLSPPQQPAPSAVPPPASPSSRPPQAIPTSTLVDRPTKKRGKLPKETTDYLKAWLHRHSDHPYPSEEEKKQLCHATGLSMSQVSNWMINVSHPLTPVPLSTHGTPTRHDAGSWHPPIEQRQVLPHRRHIPRQHGLPLPLPQCWNPCPVDHRYHRNRCNCITPCRFSPFRRLIRITHPRHQPIMWGRTGILSDCHSGHHTRTTEDQVVLTFPNQGIL